MNDKHEDEDFEARFEREIDFSSAQPYPRAKALPPQAPDLFDRQRALNDGVEANAIKRKRKSKVQLSATMVGDRDEAFHSAGIPTSVVHVVTPAGLSFIAIEGRAEAIRRQLG